MNPISEPSLRPIDSVYVVEPKDHGWIIERLMRDITAELNARALRARVGPRAGYDGEDVILNSRYLTPLSDQRARVNALFITHIDDRVKEMELRSRRGSFNSLICMSGQEADFISGLVGDRTGVVGINLPARDLTVGPVRVALFSAHYDDGRKNEQWLIDYFKARGRDHRDNFVICLMGWGWEQFCTTLGQMEMSYEIYRYSRFTPGEYGMYKSVLPSMDALAYLGFDGGAMCVYDALSAGVDVIATDISYHRGLGESVFLVSDQKGFFEQMDRLHDRNMSRKMALRARSVEQYVDQLLAHWNQIANGGREVAVTPAVRANEVEAVQVFRSHYKPIGLSRVRSFAIRFLQGLLSR